MSIKLIAILSLIFLTTCNCKATKITVIGTGNIGEIETNVLVINEVASEIVLIDRKEGLAEGKAIDIM